MRAADARRTASIMMMSSTRFSLAGRQVELMMKMSFPRTESLISMLTSPSRNRLTVARPGGTPRLAQTFSTSAVLDVPAKIINESGSSGNSPKDEGSCESPNSPNRVSFIAFGSGPPERFGSSRSSQVCEAVSCEEGWLHTFLVGFRLRLAGVSSWVAPWDRFGAPGLPPAAPPRRNRGNGWGARIRTWECWDQNPVPYRLATPQDLSVRPAVGPLPGLLSG